MRVTYRGFRLEAEKWRPRGGPWLTDWSIRVDGGDGPDIRFGRGWDPTPTRQVIGRLRKMVDHELARPDPWHQTDEEKRADALSWLVGASKSISLPSVGVGQ